MQNTSNYNLNIVEGTDIVNIPVQLNPNFQTIDAEMFKNKQSSIGTATEVVTGTVHAVVRANTDADMFRFTATGAWTAGDTMTLDGSAVTVHLADGTAPATGAYIIGAEVVAVVNGTLVTLLTSAAQPAAGVTSFNSRTGAVVPTTSDYDASMVDYDNTGSGLLATDTQGAIDELAARPTGTVDYSTTEHIIGTWIDGSTLYEKTVNFGSLPNATSKTVAHSISNLNAIVEIKGTAWTSGLWTAIIPNVSPSNLNNQISISVDTANINITSFGDQTQYTNCYITLRYVKSI